MKVTTVGDELIYANGKSKVITIAGRDRSAIGLAGQYGTAYMHNVTTGRFITSNIIGISWTGHDYVNHRSVRRAGSRRIKRSASIAFFAELFDYLDQRIGLQNVLITRSADHGFMNVPEYSQSRRFDAGRIDPNKMIDTTNTVLSAKFGEGKYITAWWNQPCMLIRNSSKTANSTRWRSRMRPRRSCGSIPA